MCGQRAASPQQRARGAEISEPPHAPKLKRACDRGDPEPVATSPALRGRGSSGPLLAALALLRLRSALRQRPGGAALTDSSAGTLRLRRSGALPLRVSCRVGARPSPRPLEVRRSTDDACREGGSAPLGAATGPGSGRGSWRS